MTINKSKGNMYKETDTWNCMYGICSHNCNYCFNRRWWKKWGKMRFNEKAFKENLGSGNFWFVGSSCDMFADDIPEDWIIKGLEHLRRFDNTYLLQSKNPKRFKEFFGLFPDKTILGTTIETNYKTNSKAPTTYQRYDVFANFRVFYDYDLAVIIEPIMNLDVDVMVGWIKEIEPKFVYIGANTNKKVKLPEPTEEKIKSLIEELRKFTEVRIKDNLSQLGDFSSNEGMELSLNPIPSQKSSGTKPSTRGI